MPNGQNQNGLKTKEMEKKSGSREIEASLSPTQAQLQPLAHYFQAITKEVQWFINLHESSSLTNVGHKHSLRV